MDFRLDDQQRALQDTIAGFCATRYPLEDVAQREAPTEATTRAAWQELSDLGVFSLLVPESAGGLGLEMVDATLVFEQLGRHLVPGPLLWSTLGATALAAAPHPATVMSGFDQVEAGDDPILVDHAAELESLLVLRADRVSVLVAGELGEAEVLTPFDPLTPVGRYATLGAGTTIGDAAAAVRLRAQGTVLAAALLVGIAEAALALARQYSLERQQFDRPIASFQVLKHMMADMYVRTGLARSSTYAAAAVLDDPQVGDRGRSVSAAKLLAGEAAIDNARATVQILGGMGFTWEMPSNHLLKRAWVLEESFGTSTTHALSISDSLATTVPKAGSRP
jgi:alkylation response protein AidB-like acyl-CoA dehydrogenase